MAMFKFYVVIIVVQLPSCVRIFETQLTAAHQASLTPTHLPNFAQVHVHCIGDAIQPSYDILNQFFYVFLLLSYNYTMNIIGKILK